MVRHESHECEPCACCGGCQVCGEGLACVRETALGRSVQMVSDSLRSRAKKFRMEEASLRTTGDRYAAKLVGLDAGYLEEVARQAGEAAGEVDKALLDGAADRAALLEAARDRAELLAARLVQP